MQSPEPRERIPRSREQANRLRHLHCASPLRCEKHQRRGVSLQYLPQHFGRQWLVHPRFLTCSIKKTPAGDEFPSEFLTQDAECPNVELPRESPPAPCRWLSVWKLEESPAPT